MIQFLTKIALGLLVSGFSASCLSADDPIRDSVVKIHVTSRSPDFRRPWTKQNPRKSSGTGVIIDTEIEGLDGEGPLILTNAHVVRYSSQIYVQPNQTTDKYVANVVAMAPGIDLAIVRLKKPEVIAENPKLSLTNALPSVKDSVNVYGFPLGGDDLSVTEGIVSRIEFSRYYFLVSGARIQVDAALNPGNSGGPAVSDGKIIGLVFSRIQEADNIGYLIPATEIQLFFKDIADGQYDGKPIMLTSMQTAENPALRERLKMTDEVTGLIVNSLSQDETDSNKASLKKWDVVTHIGPHSLDNRGMVRLRNDLRLHFQNFIPEFVEDGTIPLTIFRDGESQEVRTPVFLGRSQLIPMLEYDYPDYAIVGPLVFMPAVYEFVEPVMADSRGFSFFASRKSVLISRFSEAPAFDGEQLVIISNRMFPHPIRKGYGNPMLNVLSHINDEKVKNLEHAVTLIRDATGEFLEFTFAGHTESVVFKREEFLESTETILESEGIRYQFSKSLRGIWDSE